MLVSTKHTNLSQSLLGFGGYILSQLVVPKTIDEVWNEYQVDQKNRIYPAKQSFDNLLLTLIFLYSISAIEEDNGLVRKCD